MSTIEMGKGERLKILDGSTTIHVGWGLFLIGLLMLLVFFGANYWGVPHVLSIFSRYVFGFALLLLLLGISLAYVGRGWRAQAEQRWAVDRARGELAIAQAQVSGMREVLSPHSSVRLDVSESQSK